MSSWYVNKIIIDSREKERGINAYNKYANKYDVSVEQLKYGDFLFETTNKKQVVFEYKTCEDFINSLENKSLFHEVSNQTMNYEYSYLIICGDFNKTYKDLYFGVPHYRYKYKTFILLKNRLSSQIKGAFNRIYAMYVPIIFVDNEEEAFDEMLKISSKIADAKKYGGVVRPSVKQLELNPIEFFLTGINGIGEKKAKNITNELGLECVKDLCNQKPSDFLSVTRVNEKNVCELWKKIHNEDLTF